MEKDLGIAPLPISINEYSGSEHIDDEGQPGASAPLIAKFERLGVDTACLTYWDVPHPGRLGTLLASDTERNGGWWFYKWYGDMSGEMVQTLPPAENDVTTLDASPIWIRKSAFASVLFAGENDGSIVVSMSGFEATGVFGSRFTPSSNAPHGSVGPPSSWRRRSWPRTICRSPTTCSRSPWRTPTRTTAIAFI